LEISPKHSVFQVDFLCYLADMTDAFHDEITHQGMKARQQARGEDCLSMMLFEFPTPLQGSYCSFPPSSLSGAPGYLFNMVRIGSSQNKLPSVASLSASGIVL
jgi:hypothetical protein